MGLAAHYLIGIMLTLVYLGLLVVAHATPTTLSAILYGTATTAFPWFLMFPSQGMGWLGRDAPGDAHLPRVSPVQSHHLRPGDSPVDGGVEANLKFTIL